MLSERKQIERLVERQRRIKDQIGRNLDLLVGSVGKSPAMRHHNLTTKVDGKTVTLYVRKGLVPIARTMTARHAKVKKLIAELSRVNWKLLKLENR